MVELLEINLSVIVFMPLAAGLIGALLPGRFARWPVLAATVGVLAYAALLLVGLGSLALYFLIVAS